MSDKTTPRPWFVADWDNDVGDNLVTIEARSKSGDKWWPDGVRKHRVGSTEEGDHPIADAALIVRAVNAHDDLVKALEAVDHGLAYYIGNPSAWDSYDEDMSERISKAVYAARAALSKAKGEA